MTPIVTLEMIPEGACRVKAKTFMGKTLFQNYISVAGMGTYDPKTQSHLISEDQIQTVIEKFQEKGFSVQYDKNLVERKVQVVSEKREDELQRAIKRLNEIEQRFSKKKIKLYPFQREGVLWLAQRNRALLADQMGTGKTPQTLAALPDNASIMVVCPAVVKGVWAREIVKWRPDYRIKVLVGRKAFTWAPKGWIYILNYDILPKAEKLEKLFKTHPNTIIVADEAHQLKNSKSLRFQNFKTLSEGVEKVWLLTGTPLMNQPLELWNVLQSANLAKEAFGSWEDFLQMMKGKKKTFGRQGKFGGYSWGVPDPKAAECLKTVSLRRTREQVLPDLPIKTHRDFSVPLSKKTANSCNAANKIVKNILDNCIDPKGFVQSGKLAKFELKFEQIAQARKDLAEEKIHTLEQLIDDYEEQDHRVVVFSAHRAPIDKLASRPGWGTITGSTPAKKRSELEEMFQKGLLKGIAGTIQAMGVGITLTHAHEAIFVDQMWTPALNDQAEDRLMRIGQTKGVIITLLVADHPLDKRVTELLNKKKTLIDAVVK